MSDESSLAFYETALYFIPILVCDMESDYIFAEGVFPSVYNMGTSLYNKRFLLRKYV